MTKPRSPENEWATSRKAVWQGWPDYKDGEEVIRLWTDQWWKDQDGGIWAEAVPEVCKAKGNHLPRPHPGAEWNPAYCYCVRCGKHPVPWDSGLTEEQTERIVARAKQEAHRIRVALGLENEDGTERNEDDISGISGGA